MNQKSLTIVHVIFKNILWSVWNIKNTNILNPNVKFSYLLIDNDTYIFHLRNMLFLKCFKFFLGAKNLKIIRNKKNNLELTGSNQHASGLDFAGSLVESHLVVIQDPDCIMLKYGWIEILYNTILSENFDLIGTPEAKSDLNSRSFNSKMEYKFISPLPFLIFGKSEVIFAQSFMPDSDSKYILDTGYRLSMSCLTGENSYLILNAYSSRSSLSEIGYINNYSCTFYDGINTNNETWCVHFGRGSNRFGKNRSGLKSYVRLIKAFTEPITFRRNSNEYINSLINHQVY
jgi:hypothetical protein